MNSIIEDTSMDVFHSSLDADEQRAVADLVDRHRGNAAMTQRMALDASRLLSSSQERLQKQAGAGFCKRLLSAISGSTRNNALANQHDTLKIQKVAWHYLQQLQQQNLINAQAIAVIRNNLGTMNEFIIETRCFLDEAIDRIGNRLRPLENNARLNKWSLSIEASKRRYRSLPRSLLVVQLAYDFMLKHQDIDLTLEDINHLVVTLENLDVNCDEEVRLLDFIIDLIDQMDVTGIDLYRRNIQIVTEDIEIESAFIQSNVSGIGFNALYYLSDQHSRIMALISDDELCNSDAAREKIISRIFGDEFDGLATTYKLRDLVAEIVGGGLLVIAIYRDINGLGVEADVLPPPEEQVEKISLISQLPDIKQHSFMDATEDADQRCTYIELLSLCLPDASECGPLGRDFISHLAAKADTPTAVSRFLSSGTRGHMQAEQLEELRALLTDDNRVYCWLLDAFFLLSIEERNIESPQVMRILGALKPTEFKQQLAAIQVLMADEDHERVLQAGAHLSRLTAGWSNVLRYREFSLSDTFTDATRALHAASLAAIKLSGDLSKAGMKAIDYSYFLGASPVDEGIFSKFTNAVGSTAFSVGRKSCTSTLNQMRGKVVELLATHSGALSSANALVSRFGPPRFDFENESGYTDFDLDNSAENEQWSDQFEHYQRRLEKTLDGFSSACDDADRQLGLFGEGDFTTSVLERRIRERELARQQQREKDLASRSAIVEKEGQALLVSIDWEDMPAPPCDPEQIRNLKTDGERWLVADQEGRYYLSGDCAQWEEIHPFGEESTSAREIHIVDGTWILTAYREGFAYSSDGRHWKRTPYPIDNDDYSCSPTDDIVRLNDTWIWRFLRDRSYKYTKKGLVFDSEETGSYRETVLFATPSLDSQWSRWEGTPNLPEGMEVDALRALPGHQSLLISCTFDSTYGNHKKKTDLEPAVKYFVPGKGWRNCTWDGKMNHGSGMIVTRMADQLMCFGSNTLLRATKAYEWAQDKDSISVRDVFHLRSMSVFWHGSHSKLLLSQDGRTFADLTLEDGSWNYLCANDQGLLCLYSPSSHETWLRTGRWRIQPQH
ncbi:phage tail tape measure protein [Stenotrophomonas maltophilia]|nr:phage tail tape measure protein [Stenotrophomonas maltophilia]